MAPTSKPIARDKIAEAKHLYENSLAPVADIAALLGISPRTLSRRVSEWDWKKRKPAAPDARRVRRSFADVRRGEPEASPPKGAAPHPQAPQDRIALAERIQAAAEREIAAVEQILTVLGASDPASTEGAARTLASLARTLRELVNLDRGPPPTEPVDEEHRDLDELRRALARRLDELVAEAKAVCPDEGEVDRP